MATEEISRPFYDRRIWSSRAFLPAILLAGIASGLCFEATYQIEGKGDFTLHRVLLIRLCTIGAVQAIGWAFLLPFVGRANLLAAVFLGLIWQPLTCVLSLFWIYGLVYIAEQWECFFSVGSLVGVVSRLLFKFLTVRND